MSNEELKNKSAERFRVFNGADLTIFMLEMEETELKNKVKDSPDPKIKKKLKQIEERIRSEYKNKTNIFYNNQNIPPSEEFHQHWLFSFSKKKRINATFDEKLMGKWVIFREANKIDALWSQIKMLTEKDKLGFQAKVSTKRYDPKFPTGRHVIIVFTKDYTDKDELTQTREELRRIGVTEEIGYKLDTTTAQGIYGENEFYLKA